MYFTKIYILIYVILYCTYVPFLYEELSGREDRWPNNEKATDHNTTFIERFGNSVLWEPIYIEAKSMQLEDV